MKIENNIDNDTFSASHIIGDKLLQGWTLLNASCHICNITPLIKQKNKEERFCARCNLFIKLEKSESDDLDEVKKLDTKKEDKEITSDSIKYIKEIKLQNKEFSEILNKNHISKDEIQNLFEYKSYIKERCGYSIGDWLNFDKEHNENEIKNEHSDSKVLKENNFLKDELSSKRNGTLTTEDSILNKTKQVLIDKLEKYSEILSKSDNQNEEIEFINKISNIITILEKVNSLKNNIVA